MKIHRMEIHAKPDSSCWNDTGLDKEPGQRMIIKYVSGRWKLNTWEPADGLGNSEYIAFGDDYLMKGVPEGALVGKVANFTFYIGSQCSVPDCFKGRLFLGVNDSQQGFYDNSGSLMVEIMT
jgi:hypothetical protein